MWYIDVFKSTRHRILSTNRCSSHSFLRINRTKQSSSRITPSLFAYSTAKEFLERKTAVNRFTTHTCNLSQRTQYCSLSTMPRRPLANTRIITISHNAYSRSFQRRNNRNLCNHTSFWSTLIFSAIREQYSRRTN